MPKGFKGLFVSNKPKSSKHDTSPHDSTNSLAHGTSTADIKIPEALQSLLTMYGNMQDKFTPLDAGFYELAKAKSVDLLKKLPIDSEIRGKITNPLIVMAVRAWQFGDIDSFVADLPSGSNTLNLMNKLWDATPPEFRANIHKVDPKISESCDVVRGTLDKLIANGDLKGAMGEVDKIKDTGFVSVVQLCVDTCRKVIESYQDSHSAKVPLAIHIVEYIKSRWMASTDTKPNATILETLTQLNEEIQKISSVPTHLIEKWNQSLTTLKTGIELYTPPVPESKEVKQLKQELAKLKERLAQEQQRVEKVEQKLTQKQEEVQLSKQEEDLRLQELEAIKRVKEEFANKRAVIVQTKTPSATNSEEVSPEKLEHTAAVQMPGAHGSPFPPSYGSINPEASSSGRQTLYPDLSSKYSSENSADLLSPLLTQSLASAVAASAPPQPVDTTPPPPDPREIVHEKLNKIEKNLNKGKETEAKAEAHKMITTDPKSYTEIANMGAWTAEKKIEILMFLIKNSLVTDTEKVYLKIIEIDPKEAKKLDDGYIQYYLAAKLLSSEHPDATEVIKACKRLEKSYELHNKPFHKRYELMLEVEKHALADPEIYKEYKPLILKGLILDNLNNPNSTKDTELEFKRLEELSTYLEGHEKTACLARLSKHYSLKEILEKNNKELIVGVLASGDTKKIVEVMKLDFWNTGDWLSQMYEISRKLGDYSHMEKAHPHMQKAHYGLSLLVQGVNNQAISDPIKNECLPPGFLGTCTKVQYYYITPATLETCLNEMQLAGDGHYPPLAEIFLI